MNKAHRYVHWKPGNQETHHGLSFWVRDHKEGNLAAGCRWGAEGHGLAYATGRQNQCSLLLLVLLLVLRLLPPLLLLVIMGADACVCQ